MMYKFSKFQAAVMGLKVYTYYKLLAKILSAIQTNSSALHARLVRQRPSFPLVEAVLD
jgi:hypothetical protein